MRGARKFRSSIAYKPRFQAFAYQCRYQLNSEIALEKSL